MLTGFQWFSFICIFLAALAGGFLPIFRQERAKSVTGFPLGQAFAAGVFIALALTIMLPSAFHLFHMEWPDLGYPLSSLVAIASFFIMLLIEHITTRTAPSASKTNGGTVMLPIIMTLMIVIPSFFLGAALGISELIAEVFIFVAIIAHKSSAGFALALKMVRSNLSRWQVIALYLFFAFSTPVGIVVGRDLHEYLTGSTMHIVKAFILSMAAGTFLFMSTLHEFQDTPLIKDCGTRKGFAWAIAGFALTAFVRFLLGEAHRF